MSGDNQWGQQQGGWGSPNSAQQQGWGSPPAQQGWDQQQQQGGWGAQNPQQQGWGSPPAQQGWDQQQQQGGWGTPAPAQQQGGWGAPPAQAAPAQDPWSQAPQQQGWSAQAPAQQGFGGTGSGQNWGQPAQQSPAQNAWGAGAPPQPAGTPAWGQPAPAQQGFSGEGPDSDRTVLRAGSSAAGMAMGGVALGRLGMVRIEEGKEPGRVYEVRKEALSIGRSRESDIFLEDLAVSRLHASIISQGNGNYALRDEGSANGTKVNGQPVNKYQPYPLQDGDKIQLGQTVLVFGRR